MAAKTNLNTVVLSGSISFIKDPTYTDRGVMKLTILVNVDPTSEQGNVVPVVLWGNTAEFVYENITRGTEVVLTGKIIVSQYMKNEVKTYYTFVQADFVKVVGTSSTDEYENEEEDEEPEPPKRKAAPPPQKKVAPNAVKSTKTWGNGTKSRQVAPARKKVEAVVEEESEWDDDMDEEDAPL